MDNNQAGSTGSSETMSPGEIRARRFRVTFEYIDTLLEEIEGLTGAHTSRRVFPRILADITPDEGALLKESIAKLRCHLLRIMGEQGIPAAPPSIRASHAIGCCLTAIHITLEELQREQEGKGCAGPARRSALRDDLCSLKEMIRNIERQIDRGLVCARDGTTGVDEDGRSHTGTLPRRRDG